MFQVCGFVADAASVSASRCQSLKLNTCSRADLNMRRLPESEVAVEIWRVVCKESGIEVSFISAIKFAGQQRISFAAFTPQET